MSLHIKPCSSPSPSKPARRRAGARQGGYALLIMMMMVTLILVSLTVALPSIYTEGKREREEDLIFRGNEYARAIGLFRRRFGRFPSSVEELLKTNGIRFLRRAYRDPMTKSGKWRFIHANANGTLLDSKVQAATGQAGGPLGQNPASNSQSGAFHLGPAQTGQQGASSFFGPDKEIHGGFIAGVASSSTHQSIRVLNRRKRYDEWEFLGLEQNVAALGAGVGGQGEGGGVGPAGQTSPGTQPTSATGKQPPTVDEPEPEPEPETPQDTQQPPGPEGL